MRTVVGVAATFSIVRKTASSFSLLPINPQRFDESSSGSLTRSFAVAVAFRDKLQFVLIEGLGHNQKLRFLSLQRRCLRCRAQSELLPVYQGTQP